MKYINKVKLRTSKFLKLLLEKVKPLLVKVFFLVTKSPLINVQTNYFTYTKQPTFSSSYVSSLDRLAIVSYLARLVTAYLSPYNSS